MTRLRAFKSIASARKFDKYGDWHYFWMMPPLALGTLVRFQRQRERALIGTTIDRQLDCSAPIRRYDGGEKEPRMRHATRLALVVVCLPTWRTPITSTRQVTNGTTYFYVVSGFNEAGQGPDSNQASATP